MPPSKSIAPHLPDSLQQPGHDDQEMGFEFLEIALEVANVGIHLVARETATPHARAREEPGVKTQRQISMSS